MVKNIQIRTLLTKINALHVVDDRIREKIDELWLQKD